MKTLSDKKKGTTSLTLGALGVVFGDIGTSPLYALRECLSPARGVVPTPDAVVGIASLLVWTLVLVVTVKYLTVVLRADNRGEGGILALVSLVGGRLALGAGILGAALLYADGALTPAVSVLSALEGLTVLSPDFQPWIVPLSLGVLVVLFAVQSRGTGAVSRAFGPVIVVWFVVIGALGLGAILGAPAILMALSPVEAVRFAVGQPVLTFFLLGAVFLAVTGAEALYADLGHFGPRAIRRGWTFLAFPALLLNYLGQGAWALAHPHDLDNLFFQLVPAPLLVPVVILATLATVIASQAVITGAFSLARQSVQLGLWPRVRVVHTSAETEGQVYVPFVNGALWLGTVALVLGFGSSAALADAYGIAVSGTMLLTTLLLAAVARRNWKTPWVLLVPLVAVFLAVDGVFFGANATKLFSGGWVVLGTALALMFLMVTWRQGRALVRERMAQGLSMRDFVRSVAASAGLERVDRVAVFLSGGPDRVPGALLHNLKHNQVLHRPTWVVHVATAEQPFVAETDRSTVVDHGAGVFELELSYGFSESPNVPADLGLVPGGPTRPDQVTYFLGKQTLVVSGERRTMRPWRKRLFVFLTHNASEATVYYQLPPGQVIELGGRTEL